MKTCNFVRRWGARFIIDKSGSMAMAWGVSMVAVIFAIGSAFDASQASKAKQLAQSAADNMALTASIAVDRGNEQKFAEGQPYTYAQIGGPSEDFTGTMKGTVEYDVQDGADKLIARATITGSYSTAFMNIIGVKSIGLKAVSDVAYAEIGGTPTSIFFVVDNSGSMSDKITTVENSLKDFMTTLESLDSSGVDDIFRTGLFPYSAKSSYDYEISNDGRIKGDEVSPDWGVMSTGDITRMRSRSGTNSSGALQKAADDFVMEGDVHKHVNGEKDPLKFAVFMTDGANNTSTEYRPLREDEKYWIDRYNGTNNVFISTRWWFDDWVDEYPAGTGDWEELEVETTEYHFDRRSLEACDQMKDAGTIIYTIAYDVDASQKAHAENFMKKCSSGDAYFKSATNASALEAVFSAIGSQIIEEVIRIKR